MKSKFVVTQTLTETDRYVGVECLGPAWLSALSLSEA